MKITKIDDVTTQAIQKYQKTDKVEGQAPEQSRAINNSSPEEKVNLSTTAKDVQALSKAISELPDVREDKVQELKDRIGKGAYKVDAEKIAEKMVGESILDTLA